MPVETAVLRASATAAPVATCKKTNEENRAKNQDSKKGCGNIRLLSINSINAKLSLSGLLLTCSVAPNPCQARIHALMDLGQGPGLVSIAYLNAGQLFLCRSALGRVRDLLLVGAAREYECCNANRDCDRPTAYHGHSIPPGGACVDGVGVARMPTKRKRKRKRKRKCSACAPLQSRRLWMH